MAGATLGILIAHNLALVNVNLEPFYVAFGIAFGMAVATGWIPAGRAGAAVPWLVASVVLGLALWAIDLSDARYVEVGATAMVGRVLVTLFGVAVVEEVIFRHWLLVGWSWLADPPPARPSAAVLGVAVSSAAFGMWHIAAEAGRLGSDASVGAIGPGLAATGAAGVLLGWLRVRSGGVLAPILAHAGFNTAIALAVWQ